MTIAVNLIDLYFKPYFRATKIWLTHSGALTFVGRPEVDLLVKAPNGTPLEPLQLAVTPLQLLIKQLTKGGDAVLDLFGGTGSASLAAIIEGRSAFYVDKNSLMVGCAQRRVAQFLHTEKLKIANYADNDASFKLPEEESATLDLKTLAAEYAQGPLAAPVSVAEEDVTAVLNTLDVVVGAGVVCINENMSKQGLSRRVTMTELHDLLRSYLKSMGKAEFKIYKSMSMIEWMTYLRDFNFCAIEENLRSKEVVSAQEAGTSQV